MTREEAIEIVKKHGILADGTKFESALRELIPELRESEDERIRKEIIDFVQWAEDRGMTRYDYHQAKRPAVWIAYLEKQKEQKPVEFGLWKDTKKELPKPDSLILVQDFDVIRSLYYEGDGYLDKADGIKLSIYQKWCYQSDVKKIKPVKWSEEDETYLQDTLWCIEQAEKVAKDEGDMGACWSARRWLKSLRPSWKSSEDEDSKNSK